METSAVIDKVRERRGAPDLRVVLAFMAIYFLWGATFLAIRVAVLAIPPFFTAGLRFFTAGSLLFLFLRVRGQPAPSAAQWRSIVVIAVCMFVVTYGALFWAEQYVPSGVTAVLEATLPLIAMILEVFIFRRQPFRWRMLAAVVLGFLGVALLLLTNTGRAVVGPSGMGQPGMGQPGMGQPGMGQPGMGQPGMSHLGMSHLGMGQLGMGQLGMGQSLAVVPCLVILGGSVAWTLGAVLTRSMPLPKSVPLAAGAEMMVGGAVLLGLSVVTGEIHPFPHIPLRAAVALLYLIVGGSLLGFTAYAWLLARMPATRVASHAYINPVVAVALGYFVAGEAVTPRMLLATALVVGSVFLLLKPGAGERPT